MLPIRDHNPSSTRPYVTWALVAINVLIFLSYWGSLGNDYAIARLFFTWGLVPADFALGNIVTSMFLHGGLLHLAGNMLFLWVFGDNLEDEMGRLGFLAFYLASGAGAAMAQVVSEPQSTVPMVGASGAIAGVMGGYLLLFPKARIDVILIFIVIFKRITVPAWLVLGLWFALQTVAGFGATPGTGGVAYWAHAGGFVAGLALAVPVWLRRGGPAFWSRTDGRPPHPEAVYTARTHIPRVRRR